MIIAKSVAQVLQRIESTFVGLRILRCLGLGYFLEGSVFLKNFGGKEIDKLSRLSIGILRIRALKPLTNRCLPGLRCIHGLHGLRPTWPALDKPRTTAPQVNGGVMHKMPNQKADPSLFAFVNFGSFNDLFLQRCRDPPIHHIARIFVLIGTHHKACIMWPQAGREHPSSPRPPGGDEVFLV